MGAALKSVEICKGRQGSKWSRPLLGRAEGWSLGGGIMLGISAALGLVDPTLPEPWPEIVNWKGDLRKFPDMKGSCSFYGLEMWKPAWLK